VTTPPLPRTSLEPVCLALAEVVRQRRERAGLSLNQLAELTRLSQQMLSFVESGRRVPTIDTAGRNRSGGNGRTNYGL